MRNLNQQKMMMKSRLFVVYFCFWLLLFLSGLIFGKAWFFSSQVAFFTSLLIAFATFKAYEKRVKNGVLQVENLSDEDDDWGQNHEEFGDKNDDLAKNQQEISIKDEIPNSSFKSNLKQNTPNYLTAFVPFRLLAYACLVVGFLVLQRHQMLDIVAFLISLAVMPIGALIFGFRSAKD